MGINLTSFAVFSRVLGIGPGFGLQQIVSSFISGMIILLDCSLIIGDCAQLENGHKGSLLELNMQLATLETFDDKEIMVPNEKLITMTFTNWTHNHKLQCYRSPLDDLAGSQGQRYPDSFP